MDDSRLNDVGLMDIAVHEAGHSVLAYRFNLYCDEVSIEPRNGILGFSVSEGEWSDGSLDDEQIIVLFAGFSAEQIFDPTADIRVSASDIEKAEALLNLSKPSDRKDREKRLRERTIKLLRENWKAVTAVAEALVEHRTLIWQEWTCIVDWTDEDADWRSELVKYSERILLIKNSRVAK